MVLDEFWQFLTQFHPLFEQKSVKI